MAKARQHLGGFDDAAMGATWRPMSGGREVMAMPRAAFARAIMLNHWYHYRGQLLVYLRLLDVRCRLCMARRLMKIHSSPCLSPELGDAAA